MKNLQIEVEVLEVLEVRPVNRNADDVEGGDGGHVDVHGIVQVTHEWSKSPISFQLTIKPINLS